MGDDLVESLDEDSGAEIAQAKAGRVTFARRFLGDRRGSTAIEFAMLAIPFALLVFAILESCISFAGQEVMANVTDDIARQLRTGQLRQADLTGTSCKDSDLRQTGDHGRQGLPGTCRWIFASSRPSRLRPTAGFKIAGGKIVLTMGPIRCHLRREDRACGIKNMLRVFYPWPVMTDFMAK